jgi:histidinol-phosphate aminotransferase
VARGLIRLDSNENPDGPGDAALDGLRAALGESARYPDASEEALRRALAAHHDLAAECVLLGCGSTEVLRMAVAAFTAPARALVTAAPTFEDPAHYAATTGAPVVAVPVDGALRLDLAGMAARASGGGAGLVYVCNPNNPTATVHPAAAVADFLAAVGAASPGTVVLVDEAYHEYVDDPRHATAIPLAAQRPGVVVSRTFSKVYGMAGLRVGYAVAHPDTALAMGRYQLYSGVNVLAASAALASLGDPAHVERERARNRAARAFTRRFFESAGYAVVPSETNFLMADIRRDPKEFKEACRREGVLVGRPFPPLATYTRVSIGTMDEMRRATEVFRRVLSAT